MSSRNEKAQKQLREKHQVILNELLKEDANRFCADCESKGPRWSSWNLGVFLCIRCAGIHRNLGVHISKVKSVNLDSWTVEQIDSVQKWGNKRGKECYECYLPDDFQRPHGDSAMEQFIRNKYERQLYKKKDGEPPPNNSRQKEQKSNSSLNGEKKTRTIANVAEQANKQSPGKPPKEADPKTSTAAIARPHGTTTTNPVSTASKTTSAPKIAEVGDLLALDDNSTPVPAPQPVSTPSENELSLFGVVVTSSNSNTLNDFKPTENDSLCVEPTPHMTRSSSDSLLMGEPEKTMSTKESILSLYQSNNQPPQQKIYNVPGGMYMTQQRPVQFQGYNQIQNMQRPSQQGMRQPQPSMQPAGYGQMRGFQNPGQPQYHQMGHPVNQHHLNAQMNQLHLSHSLPSLHQAGFGGNQIGMGHAQMRPNQANNFGGHVTHHYGAGQGWNPNQPMMHNQQPIAVNGPPMGGFGASPVGNMQGPGHTMSSQLWK